MKVKIKGITGTVLKGGFKLMSVNLISLTKFNNLCEAKEFIAAFKKKYDKYISHEILPSSDNFHRDSVNFPDDVELKFYMKIAISEFDDFDDSGIFHMTGHKFYCNQYQ